MSGEGVHASIRPWPYSRICNLVVLLFPRWIWRHERCRYLSYATMAQIRLRYPRGHSTLIARASASQTSPTLRQTIESHNPVSTADLQLPIWYRPSAGYQVRTADGNHGRITAFKHPRRIPIKTAPAAHKLLYRKHLRRHQHCRKAGRGLLSMVGWVKTIFVPLACNPPTFLPTSPTRFRRV